MITKNKILIAAVLVLFTAFAFKPLYELKNNTAEVNRLEGVYIFVDSKPVKDYIFLGTIKAPGMVGSKDYEDLSPKMVKLALKKYPEAEAVIFKAGSIYELEAIKFK